MKKLLKLMCASIIFGILSTLLTISILNGYSISYFMWVGLVGALISIVIILIDSKEITNEK